jgi:hypothetical protein
LGTYGAPGPWSAGPSLLDPAAFSTLAPYGESLILAGGTEAEGLHRARAELLSFDDAGDPLSWALASEGYVFDAQGGAAATQGALYGLPVAAASEPPAVQSLILGTRRLDPPCIFPGSGLVRTGTKFQLLGAPGGSIRYTAAYGGAEPPDPDQITSKVYSVPVKVTQNTIIKARAYPSTGGIQAGLEASAVARASYIFRPGSMFVQYDRLSPTGGDAYADYALTDSYAPGGTAQASVWFKLEVYQPHACSLAWLDADSPGSVYAAKVKLSLFEEHLDVLARDARGLAFESRRGESVGLNLPAGSYYLQVEDSGGAAGGGFALRFSSP